MASPVKQAKAEHISKGFTEVAERGKGYLKSRKPGTEQYALTTQVGGRGWHFGVGSFTEAHEVDTTWEITSDPGDAPYIRRMRLADYHALFGPGNLDLDSGMPFRYESPTTGDYIQWQPAGQTLQWTNDLNQLENVGLTTQGVMAQFPQDDTLYFPQAWGPGLDFYLELQTARLQKRIEIATAAAIGSPPQFIIDGGNPVLMATWLFQRSAGVTVWLDGVQWGEGNGQGNAEASVNYVEFKDSTGATLWYMSPAIAWDEAGEQLTGPIRFRRQGGTYFIELRFPWAWLQGATYPVTIDPTIDPGVGAGSADGRQYDVGSGCVLDTTSTFIRATPGGGYYVYAAGVLTVTGPASGDTIDVAYSTIFASSTDIDVNIDLEDTDDASALSTATNNISSRTKTGYSVRINDSGSAFRDVNSPSMVSAFQDVVNRAGWGSGNDMCMVVQGASSTGGSIWFYEMSTGSAFRFHIEYTAGGAGLEMEIAMHHYMKNLKV